jgi:predicted HicB family RNase H-like nuclease
MSSLLIYKDFKAEVRFDQDKGNVVVKIIGRPGFFSARNQRHAEEEFHRVVDKELINQFSEHEKKLLKKSFSGNIAIRTSPELHQELTLAADRAGISLNSYIENNLQILIDRETPTDVDEPVKPIVAPPSTLAVTRLLEEEKASVELFSRIESCLNKEKINIFLFPAILKRFLGDFGNSIEDISPYLKSEKIDDFVKIIFSLIQEFGDKGHEG